MTVMDYLLVSSNVFALIGVGVIWFRMNRPAKEDPRLSKGLQLLQSKISVLEDLSDRTDQQVKQMLRLIENKGAQVQETIFTAKETIHMLEQSMSKSVELAEIFEDKIPHEEIIERQSSKRYIEAAKLAHEGLSAEEIAKRVDLDIAEIEFIAKVNKDRLMFSEKDLPKWARQKEESTSSFTTAKEELIAKKMREDKDFGYKFEETFANPEVSLDRLEELGKQFRSACDEVDKEEERRLEFSNKLKSGVSSAMQSVIQPLDEVRTAIKAELGDLSRSSENYDGDADWDDFIKNNEQASQIFEEASEDLTPVATEAAMERVERQSSETQTGMDEMTFVEEPETVNQETQKKEELKQLLDQPLKSSSMFADPELQAETKSEFGKVETREDQRSWDLVNKQAKSNTEATITTAQKTEKAKFKMDIVDRIKQRSQQRKETGAFRSKIKSEENIDSLQSLEFPEIRENPNDHLG